MTVALIDADIVAYRCAASCEPMSTKPERESHEIAIWRTEKLMQDIVDATGAGEYRSFLTGSTNFRKELYPEYKANRKDMPLPVYLGDCKTYIVDNWNGELSDGCEADDMLGVFQSSDSIICSIDKDLLQIEGRHYNIVKQEFSTVDENESWFNFFRQMILGDRSDNIMGYDGKARSTVPKFLQTDVDVLRFLPPDQMFDHVWDMYDKAGNTGMFETNYKLLWIWREENDPWNFLQEMLGRA